MLVLFFPYAWLVAGMFQNVPLLYVSAGYMPVVLLIAGYAFVLRQRTRDTAKGLAFGAALLMLSILLRSLDLPLCDHTHLGTHFAWHVLNAVMLGWMIEVYRRHMLAPLIHGR